VGTRKCALDIGHEDVEDQFCLAPPH